MALDQKSENKTRIQLVLEGTWKLTDIQYSLRDVCQNRERYLIVVQTSMAIHAIAVQICQVFANIAIPGYAASTYN